MAEIRNLCAGDIPSVARLFQKTFRDPRRPAPAGLADCLADLLLRHPAHDPDIASKVLVDRTGAVTGFIGAIPLAMRHAGRAIRAAVPTSVAVDDPARDPLAGAKLVRAFLNGPQDISISEPTNPLAQGLWQRLGGEVVVSESLEWLRVFRPAGLAVACAAERRPAVRLAAPVALLVDTGFAARFAPPVPARGFAGAEIGRHDLPALLPELLASYELRPDWCAATLAWMLDHADANTARGRLVVRLVRDRAGRPVGCSLFNLRPGGIAWVLQVLAAPDAAGAVLDDLFRAAADAGAVGAKGRSQARLVEPLVARGAVLFRRHGAMIHARDPALAAAVRAGSAVTSGLAGETWMRHVSDRFA